MFYKSFMFWGSKTCWFSWHLFTSASLCPTFEGEGVSWNPITSTMPELTSASLGFTESVLHRDAQSGSQPFHSQELQMLWTIPPEPLRWDRTPEPTWMQGSKLISHLLHMFTHLSDWCFHRSLWLCESLNTEPAFFIHRRKLKTGFCPSHSICGTSLGLLGWACSCDVPTFQSTLETSLRKF